jgi:hypothetical protein
VKKTWQLVELHGCWWAYEGELPPPEAFTTHGRPRHLPIIGPFPSRAMAMTDEQRRWFYVLAAAIVGGAGTFLLLWWLGW